MKLSWNAPLFAALLLATPALAGEVKLGKIEIEDFWTRATAEGMPNGAAFMELKNEGKDADRLVSAASPVAASVELHTHLNENGVMMMRKIDAIDLAADTKVKMMPGGLHVMLMGLKEPLKQGSSIPLTLTFEKAGSTTLQVPVEAPGAHGKHDKHDKHD